ncbi:unnamed protein product [Lactuca saligna]|uniref:Uncharacterized protein n=1 Tax=Lactuca saligna TaxID=75948 RepID=A0AA35Z423_LACSI|nr:unnamed protein product [Lactuca saligna]
MCRRIPRRATTKIRRPSKLEFGIIYVSEQKGSTTPQSGANEVDVFENFCKIYKAKVGKPFGNEEFWGVVKGKPKWHNLRSVDDYAGASKRSKTTNTTHSNSSDAHIGGIDLNNNDHGMLGNLYCMHWKWSMCPNAYHGQYTKGNYNYPTVVFGAVA